MTESEHTTAKLTHFGEPYANDDGTAKFVSPYVPSTNPLTVS